MIKEIGSKPWTIVDGFLSETDFGKKRISSEKESQEEQNGANFSFIAPSSEEIYVPILVFYSNVHVW